MDWMVCNYVQCTMYVAGYIVCVLEIKFVNIVFCFTSINICLEFVCMVVNIIRTIFNNKSLANKILLCTRQCNVHSLPCFSIGIAIACIAIGDLAVSVMFL